MRAAEFELDQSGEGQPARRFSRSSRTSESADVSDEHRKQNHCEIEKRRRDRMNHYIMELASVIQAYSGSQCQQSYAKLDKLTVLRMAVQHVRSLRASLCSFSSFHLRPSFLSSGNLLKNLILQMAGEEAQDNLFLVVTCDRARILFVSESSKHILFQEQRELVGQCLFDLLHKDDVMKVKEQISQFNSSHREMLVDSRTLQPIRNSQQRQPFAQHKSHPSNAMPEPGARRSFFCRMKSGGPDAPAHSTSERATGEDPPSSENQQQAAGTDGQQAALHVSPVIPYLWLRPPPPPSHNVSINSTTVQPSADFAHKQVTESHSDESIFIDKSSPQTDQCRPIKLSTNADDKLAYKSKSNVNQQPNTNEKGLHHSLQEEIALDVLNASSATNVEKKSNYKKQTDNSPTSDETSGGEGSGSYSSISSISSDTSRRRDSTCTNETTSADPTSDTLSSSCNESSPLSSKKTKSFQNKTTNSKKQSEKPSCITSSGGNKDNNSNYSRKHYRYIVMHCTGYLKSITLRNDEIDEDDLDGYTSDDFSSDEEDKETYRTVDCLVAVCRRSPMDRYLKPDRPLTFTCRYSMEGKFMFVDQRTTVALGYTPQQLIGTSHYAYCLKNSVSTFRECHRQSILKSEPVSSDVYQFKRASGQHIWLQTSLKSFRNPWTKFIDYIVASHTTAGASDLNYNEGCLSNKFNQETISDFSLSSTASLLSLPSLGSKKSSSPDSSSNGSLYSTESCASGVNVQFILNRIDRIKSGDEKLPLAAHKKRSSHQSSSSRGDGSTNKTNEDSGNYSDNKSCSSLSSQNSATCLEFNPAQTNYYFADGAPLTNHCQVTNNLISSSNYPIASYHSIKTSSVKTSGSQQNSFTPSGTYPAASAIVASAACQPVLPQKLVNTAIQSVSNQPSLSSMNSKSSPSSSSSSSSSTPSASNVSNRRIQNSTVAKPIMASGKPIRPSAYMKQQYRHSSNQYHYRNQIKSTSLHASSGSMNANTMDSTNAPWNNSRGSMYFSDLENQSKRTVDQAAEINHQVGDGVMNKSGGPYTRSETVSGQKQTIDKLSHYIMQSVNIAPMNIIAEQIPAQMGHIRNESYSNEILSVPTYLNQDINSCYGSSVNFNQIQHIEVSSQPEIDLSMQQQLQSPLGIPSAPSLPSTTGASSVLQLQPSNSSSVNMDIPLIWNITNPVDNSSAIPDSSSGVQNEFQNVNMLNSVGPQQICTTGSETLINMDIGDSSNQMITQQCQQCANHKCTSQQIMTNNIDLNSINLSSLAVYGDLDEDQLLEYLADCEPETQLYNSIQNNSYPQYNIYR